MSESYIKSPKQVHLENESRLRMWMIFAVVAALELMVLAWTGIHNIPFLGRGIDPLFQGVGYFVGIVGEVFAFTMFVIAFWTAGKQRIVALLSHILMLTILLINSGLRYNELVSGQTDNPVVLLYAQFLAPVVMFGVIAFAAILLLHTDPHAQVREAEHSVSVAKLQLKKTSIDTVRANMIDAMGDPNLAEELSAMGREAMREAVDSVRSAFGRDNIKFIPSRVSRPDVIYGEPPKSHDSPTQVTQDTDESPDSTEPHPHIMSSQRGGRTNVRVETSDNGRGGGDSERPFGYLIDPRGHDRTG